MKEDIKSIERLLSYARLKKTPNYEMLHNSTSIRVSNAL